MIEAGRQYRVRADHHRAEIAGAVVWVLEQVAGGWRVERDDGPAGDVWISDARDLEPLSGAPTIVAGRRYRVVNNYDDRNLCVGDTVEAVEPGHGGRWGFRRVSDSSAWVLEAADVVPLDRWRSAEERRSARLGLLALMGVDLNATVQIKVRDLLDLLARAEMAENCDD